MKVFISQPMNGLSEVEILTVRDQVFEAFKSFMKMSDLKLVDSYFKDLPKDAGNIWCLGDSIRLMDGCDFIIFVPGWDDARGCRIEHEVAKQYGLNIYYMFYDENFDDTLIPRFLHSL